MNVASAPKDKDILIDIMLLKIHHVFFEELTVGFYRLLVCKLGCGGGIIHELTKSPNDLWIPCMNIAHDWITMKFPK